jgi:hypothetical protein
MQILEELGTFIISVGLAVALIGVAAVLLYYFNPQQPLDHAKAAFYPLVKPINATHVWLGVKPSADKVEVVELKYQYRGRWVDVPVARLTADRAVWLNATDGRPVAVPCSANVTVATRYGTAARSLSFTPICIQRQAELKTSIEAVRHQLLDYAQYIANYVIYQYVPIISVYLKISSLEFGIQNIVPFPLMIYNITLPTVGGAFAGVLFIYPNTFTMLPLEVKQIYYKPSWQLNVMRYDKTYRWLHVVAYLNSSVLTVWINGVLVYNGTAQSFSTTSPQGFGVSYSGDSGGGTLTVTLVDSDGKTHPVTVSVKPGVSEWRDWAFWGRNWLPGLNSTMLYDFYVMPAGTKVGDYIGVIPPFRVYSVYAVYNRSGVVVSWMDPSCGFEEKCLRREFVTKQGTYQIPGTGTTLIWNSTGILLMNQYGVTNKGAIPFRFEPHYDVGYRYKLNVTLLYGKQKLYCENYLNWIRCWYNYTSVGILELKLGNTTAAFDAYYGNTVWYELYQDESKALQDALFRWRRWSASGSYCEPKIEVKPAGQRDEDFKQIDPNTVQVTVVNVYKVHVYGCGVDRTYEHTVKVGTYTVNATLYHATDPNGNTCSVYTLRQPRNCNGVVYCLLPRESCPSS